MAIYAPDARLRGQNETHNQSLDRMTRSAMTLMFQSDVIGALLVIGQLFR